MTRFQKKLGQKMSIKTHLDDEVDPEKGDNLFSANGGVLGADMEDHNGSHYEGNDVDEARC